MMNMAICSLSSGSSGNSYLVLSETTALLVDAGVSAKQIGVRLQSLGLSTDMLNAVLITHEHQDHVKALPVLMKKLDVPFLATGGTANAAAQLVESLGCEVVKLVFLMELKGLNGRAKLTGRDVASIIAYEGK